LQLFSSFLCIIIQYLVYKLLTSYHSEDRGVSWCWCACREYVCWWQHWSCTSLHSEDIWTGWCGTLHAL